MTIAQDVVFFAFYSFLGWVWETIYCTLNKGEFQNRGFLYGPVCPIYGTSVVLAQVVFSWLEGRFGMAPLWEVFAICMVGSAVIEFSTSWYLERRFHARWWDYSHLPLNVQGRICLPVSVAFGLAGIVVVRELLPWVAGVEAVVDPLVFEAAALVVAALLGADFALTEANLSTLLQKMNEAEQAFTERGEAAYQTVASAPAELRSRATEAGERVLAAGDRVAERVADAPGELRSRATEAGERMAERVSGALPVLPERPELPSPAAARDAAADRIAEIAGSLTWLQERQLRRMTGFAPASAGARLKTAIRQRRSR